MHIRSRKIFLVVSLLIITLVIQIITIGKFFVELKNDANTLNDLSRIRGSIQRFTKLEISNSKSFGLDKEISSLINLYAVDKDLTYIKNIDEYYNLKVLQFQWKTLLTYIEDYHQIPSETNLWKVIRKSEECWNTADSSVLRKQYITDKINSYFKYFNVTIAFNLIAIVSVLIFYKKSVHNNLESSAIRDSLTGIFNRRYFDEYLKHEIFRAKRKSSAFCLIMLDIDHFKKVNDTYGHDLGDFALRNIIENVLNSIRKSDVLSRIGGEEFMVLLPDTDLKNAFDLAERIRKNIEVSDIKNIGRLTVSLGITKFKEDDCSESIMKRVDNALYLAKAKGRNRTEIVTENIGG